MKSLINTNKIMFIESSIYKMIIDNSIIETVDFIILNKNNKILLWLRNNEPLKGVYYIPGGRRYKNESIMNSARRKMKEELWLEIDIKRLTFLWIYDDIFENSMFEGIWSHYSPITYIYRLTEKEETDIWVNDSQHSDIEFYHLDDSSLHEMVKIRIQDIKNKNLLS